MLINQRQDPHFIFVAAAYPHRFNSHGAAAAGLSNGSTLKDTFLAGWLRRTSRKTKWSPPFVVTSKAASISWSTMNASRAKRSHAVKRGDGNAKALSADLLQFLVRFQPLRF